MLSPDKIYIMHRSKVAALVPGCDEVWLANPMDS